MFLSKNYINLQDTTKKTIKLWRLFSSNFEYTNGQVLKNESLWIKIIIVFNIERSSCFRALRYHILVVLQICFTVLVIKINFKTYPTFTHKACSHVYKYILFVTVVNIACAIIPFIIKRRLMARLSLMYVIYSIKIVFDKRKVTILSKVY